MKHDAMASIFKAESCTQSICFGISAGVVLGLDMSPEESRLAGLLEQLRKLACATRAKVTAALPTPPCPLAARPGPVNGSS